MYGAAQKIPMGADNCTQLGASGRFSDFVAGYAVHSWARVEDSVILPQVDVGRHAVLQRCVVDKRCKIPPGLVAGVNAADDRRRFHVSPKGITLITPEMLGQGAGQGPV